MKRFDPYVRQRTEPLHGRDNNCSQRNQAVRVARGAKGVTSVKNERRVNSKGVSAA